MVSLRRRHPFSFMVVVVRSFTFHVGVFCCWPRVWRGVRCRVVAVRRQWAVDGGGVMLGGWVCQVVACGGRGWFSWALAVICRLLCVSRIFLIIVERSWAFVGPLLSSLDGLDRVSEWALFTVTWDRRAGEADGCCGWAMCRGCGWRRWCGGGWLKKDDTSQGCDTVASRSTCT